MREFAIKAVVGASWSFDCELVVVFVELDVPRSTSVILGRATFVAASRSMMSGTGTGGKELVAFGRKPADHDQSAFQGIHAQNPPILVDEACGVPKSIFDAVDALATNSNARVLAIGNPDDPSSHFAQICKPGSGWHVITVSAFDTPAYTRGAGARGAIAAACPTGMG